MSTKSIYGIVALIALALVGLVMIQLYWIDNAMEIKQARFAQSVNRALQSIVRSLENKEIRVAYAALNDNLDDQTKRIAQRQDYDTLTGFETFSSAGHFGASIVTDSLEERIEIQLSDSTIPIKNIVRKFFTPLRDTALQSVLNSLAPDSIGKMRFKMAARSVDSGAAVAYENTEAVIVITDSLQADTTVGFGSRKMFTWMGENDPQLAGAFQTEEVDITRTVALVEDIAGRLLVEMSLKRDFGERIDSASMDSIVQSQLRDNGIDLDYRYSVHPKHELESVSDVFVDVGEENKLGRYRVELFPNDVFAEPHYLTLTFSDQKGALFRSMWWILASSVAFILTIAGAFAFTVITLLKQKKLSVIKNDFINNMTHEFKTPIATISLASQALSDPEVQSDNARLRKFTDVIYEENNRLGRQVERVLQAAALERGEFTLKRDRIDINELIQNAIDNIELQVEQAGGRITSELTADQAVINIDAFHITNVLRNLLDNAVKYSRDAPEILVTARNVRNGLEVAVRDSGIGMSKEVQKRVFERFYRAPTGNLHDVKGFGLGLNYVKTIVEAHGGTIGVKSALQCGSVFTMYFPYEARRH